MIISVVIPAYNAENSLSIGLSALQKQTRPPDEIIVVDDGSTDGTAQVARSFGVNLLCQPNQGPAAARNAGVAAAHGDVILFTDADCAPDETWVEEMIRPLQDPQVDSVKGSYKTRQSAPAARLVQYEFEERYQLLKKSRWIDFVDAHAAAFRKKAFTEIGGFDPAFPEANNEDVDLSYRLASAGKKMVFAPRAVVYHRHPDTFKRYFRLKIGRGYWRMIVYKQHPGKAVRDSYTPQLLKIQILLVYLALACLGAGMLQPIFLWGLMGFGLAFLLTCLPFVRLVRRLDPPLTLLAVWFILLRTVAFSIGILAGLVGMIAFRFQLKRGSH